MKTGTSEEPVRERIGEHSVVDVCSEFSGIGGFEHGLQKHLLAGGGTSSLMAETFTRPSCFPFALVIGRFIRTCHFQFVYHFAPLPPLGGPGG